MKNFLLFAFFLTINFSYSQDKNGYWDINRKTSSTIKLSKGQLGHLEVKLPKGTTEIAYRIVPTSKYIGALDDFSEALKNVGDKRALAAGYTASFISKLSGDVKCRYGIFNDIKATTNFYSDSDFSKGCHVKYDLINKYEVNLLRKEESPCLFNSPSTIWFVFKSENLVFDQDVIVEVIPWVDNAVLSLNNNKESDVKKEIVSLDKLWTENEKNTFKNSFFNTLRTNLDSNLATEISTCMQEKLTNKYTPTQFKNFNSSEKESIFKNIYNECSSKYNKIKTASEEKGMTYGNLGWENYENGNVDKAIEFSEKALTFDSTLGFVKANLGLFYMIKGDESKAIDFYVEAITDIKADKLNTKHFLKASLDDIEKALIKHPNLSGFNSVRNMFENELKKF